MFDTKAHVGELFNKLIAEGEEIKNISKKLYFSGNKKEIAPERYEAWKTNCLTLLRSTFSSSSPHYDNFKNLKFFDHYNSTRIYLGILRGAKDDIINGYFYHKDLMLSVNIYDSLLARSLKYIESGSSTRAVGVLETVVEEILFKIADYKKIKYSRDDKLSALAEALLGAEIINEEAENKLKEIDSICSMEQDEDLNPEYFKELLKWSQSFLYNYLGSTILILN